MTKGAGKALYMAQRLIFSIEIDTLSLNGKVILLSILQSTRLLIYEKWTSEIISLSESYSYLRVPKSFEEKSIRLLLAEPLSSVQILNPSGRLSVADLSEIPLRS